MNEKNLIARLRDRLDKEVARRNSAYDLYGMDNTPQNVDPDLYAAIAALSAQPQDHHCALRRGGVICRICDQQVIDAAQPQEANTAGGEFFKQAGAFAAQPPSAQGECFQCKAKASDGWALYCTPCRDAYNHGQRADAACPLSVKDSPIDGKRTEPQGLREFEEWLNERRMHDVSFVFHDIVAKYAAAIAAPGAGKEGTVPGYEKMRGGKPVAFWRNDALEQSARIVEQYGVDEQIAIDIRAMKTRDAQ